ncbi:hypothetical protein [Mesorhizobium sp.]|uniref:hypothetical protein n=1 Tax=Mesorhizobium sp. TaxID=1871066 RepID=UPI0025C62223|nr:hypothetical protein [Mesorhizobium sp.]
MNCASRASRSSSCRDGDRPAAERDPIVLILDWQQAVVGKPVEIMFFQTCALPGWSLPVSSGD